MACSGQQPQTLFSGGSRESGTQIRFEPCPVSAGITRIETLNKLGAGLNSGKTWHSETTIRGLYISASCRPLDHDHSTPLVTDAPTSPLPVLLLLPQSTWTPTTGKRKKFSGMTNESKP